MSQPMTLLELKDAIAKAVADEIGHGMREKCERHAHAVLRVVGPQLLATADDATLKAAQGVVTEAMVETAHKTLLSPLNDHLSFLDRLLAALEAALYAQQGQGEAVAPFIVGNAYRTLAGDLVRFVSVHNEGTSYETMADEDGVHRYTRRDFGRVTGTAHDYSDPRNTPPLYTAPPAQPAEQEGPGEEDGPWAEGWAERSGQVQPAERVPEARTWITAHSDTRNAIVGMLRDESHERAQVDGSTGIFADLAGATLLAAIADALEADTLWATASPRPSRPRSAWREWG